jgi:HEAT repeat protein
MQQQQFTPESLEVENEIAGTNVIHLQADETPLHAEDSQYVLAETETKDASEEVHEWLDNIELRPRQIIDPLIPWIFIAPLWSYVYALSHGVQWSLFYPWNWICQILLSAIVPVTITTRVSKLRREAREDQLADMADASWIGPLIDALDAPNSRRRAAAHRILPRLLARLKPSDTALLDAQRQTDLIYTLRLNRPRDMDLNVAIIKALECIGDDAALSAIEYVAERRLWLPSQRFVQRAARISLVRMRPRLAKRACWNAAATAMVPTDELTAKPRKHVPEVDALKRRLKDEQVGKSAPGMRQPFLVAAWTMLLPGSLWLTVASLATKDWLPATAYGVVCALTLQLPRYVLSHEQKVAAQRLALFDNVEGVGPLAEALEWPDPAIKSMAARSLVRLLPLLNATDSGLLTTRQRGCLHRVLRMGNSRKQEALMVAILKALEQVGDESAVPYVKQLAFGAARTRIQQRVQEKAQECLPFLEVGATQRQGSQTLLRASSVDASQPDVLLRSASGAKVVEPTQLLRAGSDGE